MEHGGRPQQRRRLGARKSYLLLVTRFLIVRHAESEWNALGRWQGWGDPPLSPVGREQAAAAVSRLRGLRGAVAASSLRRARETAEIIAAGLGLRPPEIHDGLREIDVGEWTGRTHAEIARDYPDEMAAWRQGRLTGYPGGEDRESHKARVLSALARIAEDHPDEEVLVVTHGGCLSSLERMLDVWPGRGSGNLVGRWFEAASPLRAVGERISLLPEPTEPAPEAKQPDPVSKDPDAQQGSGERL
ncbi:MAG TPA: histidine phosphatase family protein [Actinomycetota bacterium]|nr:histidine phosphatase family protein [Actinomycetota bacterium]